MECSLQSTMSNSQRRVHFLLPPTYSRPLRETERSVLRSLTNHIITCYRCNIAPVQSSKMLTLELLCGHGKAHTRDLTDKLIVSQGQVVSRTDTHAQTRVEIPEEFTFARKFLECAGAARSIKWDDEGPQKRAPRSFSEQRFVTLPVEQVHWTSCWRWEETWSCEIRETWRVER